MVLVKLTKGDLYSIRCYLEYGFKQEEPVFGLSITHERLLKKIKKYEAGAWKRKRRNKNNAK